MSDDDKRVVDPIPDWTTSPGALQWVEILGGIAVQLRRRHHLDRDADIVDGVVTEIALAARVPGRAWPRACVSRDRARAWADRLVSAARNVDELAPGLVRLTVLLRALAQQLQLRSHGLRSTQQIAAIPSEPGAPVEDVDPNADTQPHLQRLKPRAKSDT